MTAKKTRPPTDFYPTPLAAVYPLIDELKDWAWSRQEVSGLTVLYAGTGDGSGIIGAMTDEFPQALHYGVEIDASLALQAQQATGASITCGDYLTKERGVYGYDLTISNPPFTHAQAFIEKMLAGQRPGARVAALMRLGMLGSQKRLDWWKGMKEKPKIRVISKRPSFRWNGTDSQEYGWFLWGFDGPSIDWYR